MRMNSRELFELYPPASVAKERGMAMAGAMNAPRFIILELQQARLLRAVQSQRQLYELMVDFWSNHFNVFAAKGADRWLDDFLRPRHDPAARPRQIPRSFARHGAESGDAVLPRQLVKR